MQSASLPHVVAHAVPAVLQTYGAHELVVPAEHVPDPSQLRAVVALPELHVAAAHEVPLAYNWHAPAPLHTPVVPQVAASDVAHSLSGSVAAAIGPQVPSAPVPFLVAVHASQVPLHNVSQQTPSVQ